MESNSENVATSSPLPPTTVAKPKNRRIVLISVVAVAAILVVVGALLVSGLLSAPQGQNAWLFKGAYAKYEGSTSMMGVSIDFAVRQEVLDFNSTHVKMSTSFNMGSSYSESIEDETSAWVPLSQAGFMNAFEEGNLTTSYASTVNIAGFGARSCMVYEYSISDSGLAMTVYVDKQIGWPLKMAMSMDIEGYSMDLDINLTDTNIPGLK